MTKKRKTAKGVAQSPGVRSLDGHDPALVARMTSLGEKLPMRELETPVFAALIRGARAMRQASCDLLGKESGINAQTVSRVERDAQPSEATRLRILEVLWRNGFEFDYDAATGRLSISADLEAVLPELLEDRASRPCGSRSVAPSETAHGDRPPQS